MSAASTPAPAPVLLSERLALTELADADAAFVLELLNEPDFLRYIGDRGVCCLHDALHYIEQGPRSSYRQNGFGLYRMGLRSDDTPVGICGLLRRPYLDEVDIGHALLARHEGQGYALEAARAGTCC